MNGDTPELSYLKKNIFLTHGKQLASHPEYLHQPRESGIVIVVVDIVSICPSLPYRLPREVELVPE